VAEVVDAAVLGAGCFSGKLIGGNLGGTGIGACAVVSGTEASGLRWNTPNKGAEAAGAGPLRRAVEAVSGACTRRVIAFPSALRV